MGERIAALPLPSLVAAVAAFFVGLSALSTAVGFALERARKDHRIFAVPLKPGQHGFELRGNVVFLLVQIVAFSAALRSGLLTFGPGSAVATFLVSYFGFQIYYYWLHRLMHLPSVVAVHRWHHHSQVTTPLTGQSVSVFEAVGWSIGYLGVPVLQSLVAPVSFWGLFAYVVFNVYGNIVGHANVEMVPASSGSRFAALLMPPFTVHALHHARWTGHYGFAAMWMDRLFSTEWADWPALHRRIGEGRALPSLKTRGDEALDPRAG